MKKKYAFHPICLLFPQMTAEELRELAEDIRVKGLLHPSSSTRERYWMGGIAILACPIAGVKPRFVEWDGKGSPLEWVISENMVRRHLTSCQRAVLAHDLLPMLEKEAKQRKRQRLEGKNMCKRSAQFRKGKASHVAARMTKTNRTYVQAIKSIDAQAPELLEKIRLGIIKVPEATRLARLPAAERRGILRLCNGHPISAAEPARHCQAGEDRRSATSRPGVRQEEHDRPAISSSATWTCYGNGWKTVQ